MQAQIGTPSSACSARKPSPCGLSDARCASSAKAKMPLGGQPASSTTVPSNASLSYAALEGHLYWPNLPTGSAGACAASSAD